MVPCKQFSRYYLQGWSFEPSDLSPVILLSNKSSFQRFGSGTSSPHPKSGTFFFAADEDLKVHFQTFRYWSRETLWEFIEVNGPSIPEDDHSSGRRLLTKVWSTPMMLHSKATICPGTKKKPKVELKDGLQDYPCLDGFGDMNNDPPVTHHSLP